jgi:hypothetical protein
MANAAVAAVKKGCQLYKDIKGAAGEVGDVLKDLKEQFNKIPFPTNEQKRKYNEEVQRVQEIAKADPNDVFTQIGEELGKLMDAYDAIGKLFIKEEAEAKLVYKGEESVGRRALKRILIRARLDSMLAEIRETMVYKAPPELGALWGKFEAMWQQIVAEQEVAQIAEHRRVQAEQWRLRKIREERKAQAIWSGAVILVIAWAVWVMTLVKKSTTMSHGLY